MYAPPDCSTYDGEEVRMGMQGDVNLFDPVAFKRQMAQVSYVMCACVCACVHVCMCVCEVCV